MERVWICLEFHWKQFSQYRPLPFAQVVLRVEAGDLGYETAGANILREVILAQALQLGNEKAATMFETDYMPGARATARRLGGQRALDEIENFSAVLILPREKKPPRIASYQGRTPLAAWLRAVVANHWVSQTRKRTMKNVSSSIESSVVNEPSRLADASSCEELLRPMFKLAVAALPTEDRVLVKMLLLDEAPQHELARSLGVNSGTITRRRQKAASVVLARVHELAAQAKSTRPMNNCLELVLAGENVELRSRLAEVLASGVRAE